MLAKKCNPSSKVRNAGRTLSKSNSASRKSNAGRTLANHKHRSH